MLTLRSEERKHDTGVSFRRVKKYQDRMRCDVDISEVFHIIDSIHIQLGPNWQQSTTKMAVARLRCDADSSEVFYIIDTII